MIDPAETFSGVCTVIDSLRPGGAERLVLTVHKRLAEDLDSRPPIVTLYPGGAFEREAREAGVRVVSLGNLEEISALQWIRRFRGFLAHERPSIVHGHLFPVSYLVWASTVGYRSAPRIVFTEHNVHNRRREFRMLRPVERLVYSRFSRVICVSDEVRRRLGVWLPSIAKRSVVLRNCIDIQPVDESESPDKDWDCVAVGSLTPQKGHRYLIDAVGLLRDDGLPLRVAIAGDGPLRESLRLQIEQLNLSRSVRLLGEVGDVYGLLRKARLFVMASEYEGLPMAILEAMMAGLPIVATRVGGLPEVIRDDTGILIEPRSPSEIAAAMKHVLARPSIAQDLGRKGRLLVEDEFGVGTYIKDLSRILESVESEGAS